jgi:hypothetical protein
MLLEGVDPWRRILLFYKKIKKIANSFFKKKKIKTIPFLGNSYSSKLRIVKSKNNKTTK